MANCQIWQRNRQHHVCRIAQAIIRVTLPPVRGKRGSTGRNRDCTAHTAVRRPHLGDRHDHRLCRPEDQDPRCAAVPDRRHGDRPASAGAGRHQGLFGALPDHSSVWRELHSVRWRRFAAFRHFERRVDHDPRYRHDRCGDYQRGDRARRACRPWFAMDRGGAPRRRARLDRSGDAGADLPAGQDSRPGGADGDANRRSTTRRAPSSRSAC